MSSKFIVSITRVDTVERKFVEKVCTKEVPTEQRTNSGYGGREEVVFEREFQPVNKTEWTEKTLKVYEQIVDNLDLVAVINAVNAKAEGAAHA